MHIRKIILFRIKRKNTLEFNFDFILQSNLSQAFKNVRKYPQISDIASYFPNNNLMHAELKKPIKLLVYKPIPFLVVGFSFSSSANFSS